MAEYIEREALLKKICNSCDGYCDIVDCDCVNCKSEHRCDFVVEIADAPTADVVEVKHGEWLQTTEPLGWNDVECVECSVCHDSWIMDEDLCLEDYATHWHYCPTCGAKMDAERKPKETVSLVDGHIDKSNRCVSCGAEIPEGTWTCPSCDRRWG